MSGKSTIKNFADILGTAKLPERTVQICLRGDLVAELEELERELDQADEGREDSLAAGAESAELAEQIEALRAEMREHTYSFRLRGLPRRVYRTLCLEHPARRTTDAEGKEVLVESDRHLDVNVETFFEALLKLALVDPVLDESSWDTLLDRLTDRQFDDLAMAAWLLNKQEVDIPFSRAVSRKTRSIGSE